MIGIKLSTETSVFNKRSEDVRAAQPRGDIKFLERLIDTDSVLMPSVNFTGVDQGLGRAEVEGRMDRRC